MASPFPSENTNPVLAKCVSPPDALARKPASRQAANVPLSELLGWTVFHLLPVVSVDGVRTTGRRMSGRSI